MKPTPVIRKEYFLNALGADGAISVPSPIPRIEKYLYRLDGFNDKDIPEPVTRIEKYLYYLCGEHDKGVPEPVTRIEKYLYYACGFEEYGLPIPVTREELYWYDYAQAETDVKTLTGSLPLTFTTSETALRSWTLHGAHMRHTIRHERQYFPAHIAAGAAGAVDNWTIYGNAEGVGERTKNIADLNGTDITQYGVRWYAENGYLRAVGKYSDNASHTQPRFYYQLNAGDYIVSGSPAYTDTKIRFQIGTCDDDQGTNYNTLGYDDGSGFSFTLENASWIVIRIYTTKALYNQDIDLTIPLMLRKADTTPDFIPYGYQVPITVSQTGQTTKKYDIYVGQAPLTEGQSVSDTQPIEVFEGKQTIDIPLTNKPFFDITVFDYYGIARKLGSEFWLRLNVTHNGTTNTVEIQVPNSMDEGDTVTDINPIPTEIGENTISLNWNEYPPTIMSITYKK